MEERVPHSATVAVVDLTDNDEPPNRYRYSHGNLSSSFGDSFDDDNKSDSGPVGYLTLLEEETESNNTYVVQVPKDQIYRVPPPENAKIVEMHLNGLETKNRRSCCTRVYWIILILFVIGISIGITLVVLHLVYIPKGPVFSIKDVHLKNNSRPDEYVFTMKVKNPNENLGIKYQKDGNAILIFKSHKLATGKFPELEQESSDSRNVHITLMGGSNSKPPEDISNKSKHDDKKKEHAVVSLTLKMKLKGNMELGFLNLWSNKEMDVVCDFKASTLRSGTKVLRQKCDTEIK